MDGWDGMGLGWMDGIIIIGRRQSKSTFSANKGNILSVRRIGAELFSVAVSSHLKLFRAAWYVWDPQIFISEGKIVKREVKG